MTVLLDQNLSRRLRSPLASLFEEIVHVGDLGMDETPDLEIWRYAGERGWTIMSKDGDLADMALLYGAPPKVIRLRIGNGPWHSAADVVLSNKEAVLAFLADPVSSLLIVGNTP